MKKLDDNFCFALKVLIMGENPAEGGAETMKGFMQNLSWFSGISADSFVCFPCQLKKVIPMLPKKFYEVLRKVLRRISETSMNFSEMFCELFWGGS